MTRFARSVAVFAVSTLAVGACADATDPRGTAPDLPAFDGLRAKELVERQVDFGPRVPGTPGHALQLAWMLALLDTLAPEVAADTFSVVTTGGDSLELTNVVARFRPQEERRILLLAHWDTRPRSDRAEDPEDRDTPVPGANDGASGTAVLLELARLLASEPPPLGVDLLLVDGEDYGPGTRDMFFGSRRYASRLADAGSGEAPGTAGGRPLYGVLLDMVGDVDPEFPMEGHSVSLALPVVRKVWGIAAEVGHGDIFTDRVGPSVQDDHLPLNEAGLPTALVIDFSYGPGHAWWHTPRDTPDKVSAATLGVVGEVMVALVRSGG